MKIMDSNIAMESRHSEFSFTHRKESLRFWIGERRPDFENTGLNADDMQLSDEAISRISNDSKEKSNKVIDELNSKSNDFSIDPELEIIRFIMEKIFGADLGFIFENLHGEDDPQKEKMEQPKRDGWGVEYDMEETRVEKEYMSFSAEGVVKTADGKQINFELSLEMRRTFMERNELHLRAGDPAEKDPLIINYDGNAAELTNKKYAFDIDSDGKEDNIPFVKPGSGFLILDKNGDGRINNGSELFGAKTGNGFAELSMHDNDKNGWIDENDPVFEDLGIWTKSRSGEDNIYSLKQKDIGAIYLQNAISKFSINDEANNKLGRTVSSSIYLHENGRPGTVQQVNLYV